MESVSPASAGRFLSTTPPGMSTNHNSLDLQVKEDLFPVTFCSAVWLSQHHSWMQSGQRSSVMGRSGLSPRGEHVWSVTDEQRFSLVPRMRTCPLDDGDLLIILFCGPTPTSQSQPTFTVGYRTGRASLAAQLVKNPPAMQQTQLRSLGQEDPLEDRWATHSSTVASWRIPWTEEPGGLQSMGSQSSDAAEEYD